MLRGGSRNVSHFHFDFPRFSQNALLCSSHANFSSWHKMQMFSSILDDCLTFSKDCRFFLHCRLLACWVRHFAIHDTIIIVSQNRISPRKSSSTHFFSILKKWMTIDVFRVGRWDEWNFSNYSAIKRVFLLEWHDMWTVWTVSQLGLAGRKQKKIQRISIKNADERLFGFAVWRLAGTQLTSTPWNCHERRVKCMTICIWHLPCTYTQNANISFWTRRLFFCILKNLNDSSAASWFSIREFTRASVGIEVINSMLTVLFPLSRVCEWVEWP